MLPVTVTVPIHDPKSLNEEHINRLINSIAEQSALPAEIIFTANHSFELSTRQKELMKNVRIKIIVHDKMGAAANTNFAISLATEKYIKIMHQDDWFIDPIALKEMVSVMQDSEQTWLVSGFDHFSFYSNVIFRPMIPKISPWMRFGINKIGAPSVVMIDKTKFIALNEVLNYLYDCDWYLKIIHRFGKPVVLPKVLIRIGIHENQSTNWARKQWLKEGIIVTRAHNGERLKILQGRKKRMRCKCLLQNKELCR